MWDIAVIVLILLAAVLAGLVIPPLTRILFNYIVPGNDINLLVSMIFFPAMAGLGRLLLNYLICTGFLFP